MLCRARARDRNWLSCLHHELLKCICMHNYGVKLLWRNGMSRNVFLIFYYYYYYLSYTLSENLSGKFRGILTDIFFVVYFSICRFQLYAMEAISQSIRSSAFHFKRKRSKGRLKVSNRIMVKLMCWVEFNNECVFKRKRMCMRKQEIEWKRKMKSRKIPGKFKIHKTRIWDSHKAFHRSKIMSITFQASFVRIHWIVVSYRVENNARFYVIHNIIGMILNYVNTHRILRSWKSLINQKRHVNMF